MDEDLEYILGELANAFLFLLILILFFPRLLNFLPKKFYYTYNGINGPHTWRELFQIDDCSPQSPISVPNRRSRSLATTQTPPICYSAEYYLEPDWMKLKNNGHQCNSIETKIIQIYQNAFSVIICALWTRSERPTISGGPLDGRYSFLEMRFHWGESDNDGSEHILNGRKYAMEMQLAFGREECRFKNIYEASHNNGLVMISYLVKVVEDDNPFFDEIINNLRYVQLACDQQLINPIILSLLAPTISDNYFFYDGSLTIPPCTPGVKWIISNELCTISNEQLEQFRKLCSKLSRNIRPIQDLDNRIVTYCRV